MKGNAALYEEIAEVWRATTGRRISHQTVHKHITDRVKEHTAILAIPEAERVRISAIDIAIFNHANEIHKALQEKLTAERRRALAHVDNNAQAHTVSVRDDLADELVQRSRDKRPRNPANPEGEESERPTARPRTLPLSPPVLSLSLQTEMTLFLSIMNSRAASEASDGAKQADITRLVELIAWLLLWT